MPIILKERSIFKNRLIILIIGFSLAFIIYPIYLYFKEPYFSIILSFVLVIYIDNFWFLVGWLFNGIFLYLFEIYDGNFAAILVAVPIIEILLNRYKKKENNILEKIFIILFLIFILLLIFYIFIYKQLTISKLAFKI
ncbi:MAG: hypothetical protein QW038_00875 [Nanopusillaceae archaeon]